MLTIFDLITSYPLASRDYEEHSLPEHQHHTIENQLCLINNMKSTVFTALVVSLEGKRKMATRTGLWVQRS